MVWKHLRWLGVLFSVILLAAETNAEKGKQRPRLVVMVVVDQMRASYLVDWRGLLGEGGFRRLLDEGAWFQNCHYPYAVTTTAPGHATVATGATPARHGIINNEWYDRHAHALVEAVTARGFEGTGKPGRDVSPERLLAPTVADAFKEAAGADGRVVSFSMKDRSAILLGGRRPDACCWYDAGTGQFRTSAYYRQGLPGWVGRFNASRPADRWLGQKWERLRPDLDYARASGPDDAPGEETKTLGRTFPHVLPGDPKKPGRAYYSSIYETPFGNDLLLALVKQAIVAEQLGHHRATDLLCVSFSCVDSVGHSYGPNSQEVLDAVLRADRDVKELLDQLDEHVGRGKYLLTLTADHGVCPLPEVTRATGKEALRVDPALLMLKAETFLARRFGKPEKSWLEPGTAKAAPWLYLRREEVDAHRLALIEVEDALAEWLRQYPGVEAAYAAERLGRGSISDDLARQVLRSFQPERAGDVVYVVKPYSIVWHALPPTGTNHGSPHEYDTHVPLLVYGPGVKAGPRAERVSPLSVAPIVSEATGVRAPAGAVERVPAGLFERP